MTGAHLVSAGQRFFAVVTTQGRLVPAPWHHAAFQIFTDRAMAEARALTTSQLVVEIGVFSAAEAGVLLTALRAYSSTLAPPEAPPPPAPAKPAPAPHDTKPDKPGKKKHKGKVVPPATPARPPGTTTRRPRHGRSHLS